jgi:DHA1 family tetracycline resistance protein-like MFS transporter
MGLPETEAAVYGGRLQFAYALAQFLCAPIIGGLSDRFGRRPILILSLLAFGLDYIIMGMATMYGVLVVGRVIAGISGASYTTAFAYIADVTAPENRAKTFGLVGAAFGLGFVMGPALGGMLAQYGERVPFFVSATMALCNAVYGFLVLPESLPRELRRPLSLKRSNLIGSVIHLRRYPTIPILSVSIFFWSLAHMSLQSTWVYYTRYRFGWNELQVGCSLAFVGILMALVQGLLTRVLIPRLGELRAATLALMFGAAGYTLYGLANVGWMMYAGTAVFALIGLAYPSINSLMSARLPPNELGELQGAISSIQGLTAIIGPLVFPVAFAYFSAAGAPIHLPGAAFLMAAMFALLALTCVQVAAGSRRGIEQPAATAD